MTASLEVESTSKPFELIDFENWIKEKVAKNGSGGRPHFVSELAKKQRDPKEELFNIIEEVWLKNKPLGSVAKKYETSYHTLYRVLLELEPFKDELVKYLADTPRRKRFYNEELDSSDYESVQNFIQHGRREGLKNYKTMIQTASRCWSALKYKDPDNWNADEVLDFLSTLKPAMQSNMLDACRQVAPHLRGLIKTGRFREKVGRRKKDIFGREFNMMTEALRAGGLSYHETILKLHVAVGAREGMKDPKSGLCGLSWDRFKDGFTKVDLFESKVRGGIWSRDCPLNLIFADLPSKLKALWEQRGKPINDKVILGGYKGLSDLYKEMRKAFSDYYAGKLDPSLFNELTTLRPHDSDKIHCNLLWEAEVPLEVVAGQYLGRGEGIGLMGRIWLDINTIKKHYLSLTQRSERFKKLQTQVMDYSKIFNGGANA